jgi:RHS repeat-associated protein
VNYTYDGDGQRVEKSSGTLYWYGPGGEVLDETDLNGNLTSEYVYFNGRRIARRDASGNVYYYAGDFLGSSRAMVTSSGVKCYDADFYPFGGERSVSNTCPQNYKFTGKERDSETGNDYFGARYYASNFGRFVSPDPLGGNLTNPQSLNRYTYVRNNPLGLTDPTGLSPNLPPPAEGWGDWFQQLSGMCSMDFGETPCGLLGESESTASAGYVYRDPISGNTYTYAEYGGNLEADQTLREITHVCSGNSACTLQSDVLWLVGSAGNWRFLMSYVLGDRFVGTPEDQQIHALASAVVAKAGYLTDWQFWAEASATSAFGAVSAGAEGAALTFDGGLFPSLSEGEQFGVIVLGNYFPGGVPSLMEFISGASSPGMPAGAGSVAEWLGGLLSNIW